MYAITIFAIQKEVEYIEKQISDIPLLEIELKKQLMQTLDFGKLKQDYEKKRSQLLEDLETYK